MYPSSRSLFTAAALCVVAVGCGDTTILGGTSTSSTSSTSSTTGAGGATSTTGDTTTVGVGGAGGQGVGGVGGGGGATSTTTTTTSTTSTTATTGAGGSGGMPPWSGPLQALEELDLGTKTLNLQHTFPIPEHTLGFTVLVNAPSLSDVIGIQRLRPPVGGSVIFDYAMAGHSIQVFGNQGWVAGANPQSDTADAWPIAVGKWKLILGNDGSPSAGAHVSVWVRRTSDGKFHGGQLDFNLFIAPGVADEAYVKQVVNNIFAVSYGGIAVGNVNAYPLDAAYTVIDSFDEYRSLVSSTDGIGTSPAVNLFVVQDFSDPAFGGAIGVAAAVPGAAMKNGTTLSGVAYQPSGDAIYDASVLRHEIGHLAGLFHTTEFQVVETDPLSDTPTCDNAVITSTPDACPDKSNTMFPIAYGATSLTAAQIRVLQGSALYRGVLVQGGPAAMPFVNAPLPLPPAPASRVLGAANRPFKPLPAAPDALLQVLGGVWCTHSSADYPGLAIRLAARHGADAAAVLRALVLDASLPEIVRARALAAHVRAASGSAAALSLAEAIAADEHAGSDLRAAAFASLAARDLPRARLLGRAASGSADPIVRAIATRLRAR